MAKRNMSLKVAKEFLGACTAHTTIFARGYLKWKREGREVAFGVFGPERNFVQVSETKSYSLTTFEDKDAFALKNLGDLQPEVLEGVKCCGTQVINSGNKRP